MGKTETKQNETNQNATESNEPEEKKLTAEQIEKQQKAAAKKKAEREAKERAEAQRAIKENPLFFEVPLPEDEALRCLTAYLNDVRRTAATAVSVRINDGRVMVGVLPDGEK